MKERNLIELVVKPNTIKLPVGTVVRVLGSWEDYQTLQRSLGDSIFPRLKFNQGEIKLMVPLPEHGKQLDIVVDMVKVLLRHQGLSFDSYHETTIGLPEYSGIIPDHFFYIGEIPVVGKLRIDWSKDPAPDLAIELDVTSFTNVNDYLRYKIKEVWIIRQQQISIYQFQEACYIQVEESQFFPKLDLNSILAKCLLDAYELGSGAIDRLSDLYPRLQRGNK